MRGARKPEANVMLARPKKKDAPVTYRDAGVDIDAGDAFVSAITPIADRTRRVGSVGSLGGYAGLFDLKAVGYQDPLLVASSDGVGTKLKVAIETGIHDTIGIDLVAMCVNDIVVQGAEPLFFLDYFACSSLDENVAKAVVKGISAGCIEAGAELLGGETAEMPGMYRSGDYDLAGFATGVVERSELLPRSDVSPGDVIIGLASSGVHSNGFSLIRRLVAEKQLSWTNPAPFDSTIELGRALLVPTRIYVKSILATIRDTRAVKALAHITGSGHISKISRVLPRDVRAAIQLSSWETPEVFRWIKKLAHIDDTQLVSTFNCGIGMVLVTSESEADKVMTSLRRADEQAAIIGTVRSNDAGSKQTLLEGKLRFQV
jgi:phosphoribosylformylglycinamidine cyclo-ligase